MLLNDQEINFSLIELLLTSILCTILIVTVVVCTCCGKKQVKKVKESELPLQSVACAKETKQTEVVKLAEFVGGKETKTCDDAKSPVAFGFNEALKEIQGEQHKSSHPPVTKSLKSKNPSFQTASAVTGKIGMVSKATSASLQRPQAQVVPSKDSHQQSVNRPKSAKKSAKDGAIKPGEVDTIPGGPAPKKSKRSDRAKQQDPQQQQEEQKKPAEFKPDHTFYGIEMTMDM